MSVFSSDSSMDDVPNVDFDDSDDAEDMEEIHPDLGGMIGEEEDDDHSITDGSEDEGEQDEYDDGMEDDDLDRDDGDEDMMDEDLEEGTIDFDLNPDEVPVYAVHRRRRAVDGIIHDAGGQDISGVLAGVVNDLSSRYPFESLRGGRSDLPAEVHVLSDGPNGAVMNIMLDPLFDEGLYAPLGLGAATVNGELGAFFNTLLDGSVLRRSSRFDTDIDIIYGPQRLDGIAGSPGVRYYHFPNSGPSSRLARSPSTLSTVHPFLTAPSMDDEASCALQSSGPASDEQSVGGMVQPLLNCIRRYSEEANRNNETARSSTTRNPANNSGGIPENRHDPVNPADQGDDRRMSLERVGLLRGIQRSSDTGHSLRRTLMSVPDSTFRQFWPPDIFRRHSSTSSHLGHSRDRIWSYDPPGDGGDDLPRLFGGAASPDSPDYFSFRHTTTWRNTPPATPAAAVDEKIFRVFENLAKGLTESDRKLAEEREREATAKPAPTKRSPEATNAGARSSEHNEADRPRATNSESRVPIEPQLFTSFEQLLSRVPPPPSEQNNDESGARPAAESVGNQGSENQGTSVEPLPPLAAILPLPGGRQEGTNEIMPAISESVPGADDQPEDLPSLVVASSDESSDAEMQENDEAQAEREDAQAEREDAQAEREGAQVEARDAQTERGREEGAGINETTPPAQNSISETQLDFASIAAERAAAAGISLDAPANEEPQVRQAALDSVGIDPSYLAALPPDFRAEVLAQHWDRIVGSASANANPESNSTTLSPDFLVALPPEVRAEVLEQEASFRAQQARRENSRSAQGGGDDAGGSGGAGFGGGQDMDNATFLATLAPELREEIFLTSDESLISSLPPHVAEEARMLRQRDAAYRRNRIHPGARLFDPFLLTEERGSGRGSRRPDVRYRVGESEWTLVNGQWTLLPPAESEETKAPLNEKSLAALVNLLRLEHNLSKSLLSRVLTYACRHSAARKHVLENIFGLIVDPEGVEFPGMGGTAKIPMASRSVIVRRGLDLLTSLIREEGRVAEDVVAIPPSPSPQAKSPGESSSAKFEFDSQVPMMSRLASLLSDPTFGRSTSHLEQLTTLFVSACEAFPPPVTSSRNRNRQNNLQVPESQERNTRDNSQNRPVNPSSDQMMPANSNNNASERAVDAPNGISNDNTVAEPANVESTPAEEGSVAPSNPDDKKKKKNVPEPREVLVPVERRIPAWRRQDLIALAEILGRDGCSEKTYTRVLGVIESLSALPSNRETLIEALSDAASVFGQNVASSLRHFVEEQQSRSLQDSRKIVSSLCTLDSADELRLLRVAKTIAALSKKVDITETRHRSGARKRKEKSEKETKDKDRRACEVLTKAFGGLRPLWSCLDTVLDVLDHSEKSESKSNTNAGKSGRSVTGSGPSNPDDSVRVPHSGRRSGRVTIPPALALLSPVIEAFFIAHSLPGDSHRKPVKSSAESSSQPSTPRADAEIKPALVAENNFSTILGAFIARHRVTVNRLLRATPSLLDGSLKSALRHAHLIDFDNKKSYFRSLIRKRNSSAHANPIRLKVNRDQVFHSTFNQIRVLRSEDLKGRLHVQFLGEEGIDAGGLTREWYSILAREIFNPHYALFKKSAGKAATYEPNRMSYINPEHLDFFKFVGRIIGKAIYDGQLLDAYFTRSFYKHMLNIKPNYHDIEAQEPEYYKSLCWLLENDITGVVDFTMSSEFEDFGVKKIVDLVPNGRKIPVVNSNKIEYVRLITDLRLTKAIEKQITAFLEGFHELIPAEDIRIFNEVELELLMSGLPDIDVADLKANIEYSGYTVGSRQISWFWKSVSKLGREDLARLIMFVTGTSKIPIEGFSALQGMNGLQKFQIHRVPGDTNRLPTAHTCFNQLDLPEYSSEEKLHNRLVCAIREGSEGFGFG